MHLSNDKLLTIEQALEARRKLRSENKTMVLTNGCFDILHAGHISYLQAAQKIGDELWIPINSDASVRTLKGPHRPIVQQAERAYCLAALNCVDRIIIFNTPRISKKITQLTPDIYTKAGDYTIETLNKESERLSNLLKQTFSSCRSSKALALQV